MAGLGRRRLRAGAIGAMVAAGVVIGAGGCGGAPPARNATAAARGSDSPRVRILRARTGVPPGIFVTDGALLGRALARPVPLRREASPALFGSLSPLAVPSPDGRRVAYSAVRSRGAQTRPSVRLLDLATGEDSLIAAAAYSVAWRADGAFAYVRAGTSGFHAAVPRATEVVVRSSPKAPPAAWTRVNGRYTVIGWARDTLLAYAMREGERLDVLALRGPGSVRVLAPDASVVAISPDGRRVLVSDAARRQARLLDVASGHAVARLGLETLHHLSYGGSWRGHRIVAASAAGLAVLRARRSALAVERVLALPKRVLPMGVDEPQLVDASGARVLAWAPVPGRGGRARGRRYAFLDCRLATGSCTVGRPRGDRVLAQAYNPSRPQPRRGAG